MFYVVARKHKYNPYRGSDLIRFVVQALVEQKFRTAHQAALSLRGPTGEDSDESRGRADAWFNRRMDAVGRGEPLGRELCELLDRSIAVTADSELRHVASFFDSMTASVAQEGSLEPKWFAELLAAGPARSKPEILLRGRALVAQFREVADTWSQFRNRPMSPLRRTGPHGELPPTTFEKGANEVIRDLFVLMALPPGKGSYEAVRFLAAIAPASLPLIRDEMGTHPMAWRLVRTITLCLQRSYPTSAMSSAINAPEVLAWGESSNQAIADALETLRTVMTNEPRNIYRSRSLAIEAARFAPRIGVSWLDDELEHRATCNRFKLVPPGESGAIPTRERQYAGYVLWLRLSGQQLQELESLPSDHPSRKRLLNVIDQMCADGDAGVRWAGMTIQLLIEGIDVSDNIPSRNEENLTAGQRRALGRWQKMYGENADSPLSIVEAALDSPQARHIVSRNRLKRQTAVEFRNLIAQAATTCDGTTRRNILDALTAGAVQDEAAQLFELIARAARASGSPNQGFMVEQCLFCASYTGSSAKALAYLCSEAGLAVTESTTMLGEVTARPDSEPRSPHFAENKNIRVAAVMGIGDLATKLENDSYLRTRTSVARALVDRLEQLANDGDTTTLAVALKPGGSKFQFLSQMGSEVRALTYALTMLRDTDDRAVQALTDIAEGRKFLNNASSLRDFTAAQIAQWGVNRSVARDEAGPDWVRVQYPDEAAKHVLSNFDGTAHST
jgi:hypothetical protein